MPEEAVRKMGEATLAYATHKYAGKFAEGICNLALLLMALHGCHFAISEPSCRPFHCNRGPLLRLILIH